MATFHRLPNRAMSTISTSHLAGIAPGDRAGAESGEVEMRSLADICAEFASSEIDFLKIDAEGAEADVVAGGDWRQFRPRLVVIEATKPWSSELNCAEWEPALLAHDYLFQHFDGINRYYLRREDEALAPQLSVPVNVLDFCVTHRELQMKEELQRWRMAAAGAQA